LSGLTAALRVPFVLRGSGLERLLQPSGYEGTSVGRDATSRPAPPEAVRWSRGAVSKLARLPYSPWRDTCLYRSAAECLVLRRYGIPAVVRIGVRDDAGAVEAHAWVEMPEGPEKSPGYATMDPRRGP
jgi:hypothetical protein